MVRRPGTTDISYVAYKVDGATEISYPIPPAEGTSGSTAAPSQPAATPNYTTPTTSNTQAPAQSAAPAQDDKPPFTPDPAPAAGTKRTSKYF